MFIYYFRIIFIKCLMRKFLLSIAIPLIAAQASADTAGEARAVAASGDYDAALRLLRAEMEASPRTVTPQLLMLAGEYADKLGERAEATNYFEQARTRGNNAANAALASLAFREYDFNKASELYARYARGLKKGVPEDEEVRVGRERLAMARDFIDRVEKIEIIDSVAVDKGSFFRAYRLSKSAGSITDSSVLPPDERVGVRTVFTPESGDLRMWNAPGPDGKSHIMESIRLTDGSWHLPVVAPEELNEGGDAAFPYMMPDGSTFYFANNGENSIGGYDIFVSNRDTEDGSYMTPQNLGMPFNSPYDDYMLVIDENAGVGWWATDRNR